MRRGDHQGLTSSELVDFAERGYVVVRESIPVPLIDAANAAVDELLEREAPPPGHVGNHFYWLRATDSGPLAELFSALEPLARTLIEPGEIEIAFDQLQVALNIPPFDHRPGVHHLDGYLEGQSEPSTFTMLAGVLLNDQPTENGGNLWVWPGTHRTHAAFFREHGPDTFIASKGYPDILLPEPTQILGAAGDVLLAHYMLGHNIGGNFAGGTIRRAVYFRLRRKGHESRWRECLCDELLEYPAVRGALDRFVRRTPRRRGTRSPRPVSTGAPPATDDRRRFL